MDKKISELDQALQINNDAVFPISQDNGGTDTTYKVSITQISSEVGEDQTFSNLQTTSKKLVGAINELYQGGGGGGSSTLAGLNDVDIDDQTLSDGQVLKYDSAEDKWINDDVGAGGHTIVADDGTDLTQRANLQFIGAYSEDNSGDDTTEVNVVRSMTKAQFDLLTADEKTGFINTTDETSQIYATEIPMSALDSDTVAEKLDEKVDTADYNAELLPIESGSATNTKAYIDSGLSGKGKLVKAFVTYNGTAFTIPNDVDKPTQAQMCVVGRNSSSGAFYVLWYNSSDQNFLLGAVISGANPTNGQGCPIWYVV